MGGFGDVVKKLEKKVWKKFGLKGFFVVPLQPQTKKTRGDDKGHGFVLSSWLKGTTEVIEMIAIDKETVRDKERK